GLVQATAILPVVVPRDGAAVRLPLERALGRVRSAQQRRLAAQLALDGAGDVEFLRRARLIHPGAAERAHIVPAIAEVERVEYGAVRAHRERGRGRDRNRSAPLEG